MSEPGVTLHDVSVEGAGDHRDAVLAAIERAVGRTVVGGTPSVRATRAAVRSAVMDSPVTRRGNDAGQDD